MKNLKVVGITKEKDQYTFCMGGLYDLHATHGFPLFMAFSECKERGWTFSIPHLMFSALADGRIWLDYLEDVESALRDAGLGYTVPEIKRKLNELSSVLMSEFVKNNPDDGTLAWYKKFGQYGKDAIECNLYGIYAENLGEAFLTHNISEYTTQEVDDMFNTTLDKSVKEFEEKLKRFAV